MAKSSQLSLLGLIAIVFSSMVGGGIFNIAQNMASSATLPAVVMAWIITGGGMVFLVLTFKYLSELFPNLNQGLYQYAREGFGNYAGFNIAWGYWLCVAAGNVAFVVMLNDAVGAFFPVFLLHDWESILFCECLVWLMFALVARGIQTASLINTLMTCLKFSSIVIIIAILVVYLRIDILTADIEENFNGSEVNTLGSFWQQAMGTMFITMFCFVGVEGAVMLSSYAKNSKDVGRASVIGFYLALIIYALISIMCYGIRTREDLAGLPDPSVAYVLKLCCGEWAYYFVISTVILSILSAFVSWTLLCAQAPYGASKVNIFPVAFQRTNRYNVPVYGLFLTTVFMSILIIIVSLAPDVYMAALNLTTVMVLPAYGIAGAFLWKMSSLPLSYHIPASIKYKTRLTGILCVIYCLWCIVAGGFFLFLASSILYLLGFYFYYINYRQQNSLSPTFHPLLSGKEKLLFSLIAVSSLFSLYLIFTHRLTLS